MECYVIECYKDVTTRMEAKRYHYIEHEILRLVLHHSDSSGYPTSVPLLETILRTALSDIEDREVVDALKRLCQRQQLTLWKFSYDQGDFVRYPDEIDDENEVFYRDGMQLRRTPDTDPYLQELAALLSPPQGGESPRRTYGFLP